MNYTQNLSALAQYAGQAGYATDPDFMAQYPVFIDSAEQRILRDLDLLNTYVPDDTGTLSANRRTFILPTTVGAFVVLQTIRIVLPGPPAVTMPALDPISKEAMDAFYPGDGAVGNPSIPKVWCPLNQTSVMVGPAPDQPYEVKCWGTQRPLPLYANNVTQMNGTFISNFLPDLFLAAQMVACSAWERLFSASSEDPQQPLSWISEYERLMKSAEVEQARIRLSSNGWSTRLPTPTATPPQT